MNDRSLITTGAIGAVVAAICCATPLLTVVLGGIGLTWLAHADNRHGGAAPGAGSGGPRVLPPLPRWRTQMNGAKHYDLVAIGSGTAAQVASARVRAAGWSVAVIDHLPFGGTCALRGCDPKKMLISGAEAIDMPRRMRGRGVVGDLKINWRDLIAFKRTFTDPVP